MRRARVRGSNQPYKPHGVLRLTPGTLVAATPSLLRRIDETARCLAHVSAEQAVEVVYDEGADHLVRGRGGVDR